MVCLAIYMNCSERHLRWSAAVHGTEVGVPPNQFPATSLIAAATVVGPTMLTAVPSVQKPQPRLTAPTGCHLLWFRPPAPNQGSIDTRSCVLTVDLHCLPTICACMLSWHLPLLVVIPHHALSFYYHIHSSSSVFIKFKWTLMVFSLMLLVSPIIFTFKFADQLSLLFVS